jgi:hypothetical protein
MTTANLAAVNVALPSVRVTVDEYTTAAPAAQARRRSPTTGWIRR